MDILEIEIEIDRIDDLMNGFMLQKKKINY